jgi:protein-disulfide isomerase
MTTPMPPAFRRKSGVIEQHSVQEAVVGVSRRHVLIAGAACAVGVAPASAFALEGDMTIGDPAAPVQLIEYASLTCSHCAAFHARVFPQLKAAYIDTDRIGFTLREYPTAPAPIAFAMFQLARCGGVGPRLYFDRVAELFNRQREVMSATTGAEVRSALVRIGGEWGLSEADIMAAMQDEAAVARITGSMESGRALEIPGTPAIVLNGALLQGPSSVTFDGLSAALNEALSA